MAVVPAAQEPEARELRESRSLRPAWDIMKSCPQNKENKRDLVGRQSLPFPIEVCYSVSVRALDSFLSCLHVFHILFFLIYSIPIKIFSF